MSADLRAAKEAAEAFRREFIEGRSFDGRFPIDVVFIASNVLRLDFVDYPNLVGIVGAAAYITPCFTECYVDYDLNSAYVDKKGPKWMKDRLRFSVAHEIGHIRMHAALVPQIRCQRIEDLKTKFNSSESWKDDIEKEANEFAGRLIVPFDKLEESYKVFGSESAKKDRWWRNSEQLRALFCQQAGDRFGIHVDGMNARLNREELWLSEWTIDG